MTELNLGCPSLGFSLISIYPMDMETTPKALFCNKLSSEI